MLLWFTDCLMLSPLSVSTVLSSTAQICVQAIKFDLIFLEVVFRILWLKEVSRVFINKFTLLFKTISMCGPQSNKQFLYMTAIASRLLYYGFSYWHKYCTNMKTRNFRRIFINTLLKVLSTPTLTVSSASICFVSGSFQPCIIC